MDERQRAVLRKSGKQLFIDEIDELTTGAVGHRHLAEIGNVGRSELFSTCELLGWDEHCGSHGIQDATCSRVKGVLGQLRCSETTARQLAGSEFLVHCGVRGDGETATPVTKPISCCTED